jgi:hypothetical protein
MVAFGVGWFTALSLALGCFGHRFLILPLHTPAVPNLFEHGRVLFFTNAHEYRAIRREQSPLRLRLMQLLDSGRLWLLLVGQDQREWGGVMSSCCVCLTSGTAGYQRLGQMLSVYSLGWKAEDTAFVSVRYACAMMALMASCRTCLMNNIHMGWTGRGRYLDRAMTRAGMASKQSI